MQFPYALDCHPQMLQAPAHQGLRVLWDMVQHSVFHFKGTIRSMESDHLSWLKVRSKAAKLDQFGSFSSKLLHTKPDVTC
jgi:hypothetical protein